MRSFICEGGFGMSEITTGRKIVGCWKADREPGVVSGAYIDAADTAAYPSKKGLCSACGAFSLA